MRLNQIIAVEKSMKSRTAAELTTIYHALQKPALFTGIARTYQPLDDNGERFPPESTLVQAKAWDMLNATREALSALFDTIATKDWGNVGAKADLVTEEGETLLKDVPVVFFLFLEKQLEDFRTMVMKLPIVDASEAWHFEDAQACQATMAVLTAKTKKVPKTITKAQATKEHPAQTELFAEDVVVGHWSTIKYSGALLQSEATSLVRRIESLQRSVKFAREQANNVDIQKVSVAAKIFGYLFPKG